MQLGKRHQIPVVTKLIGSDVLVLAPASAARAHCGGASRANSELIVVSQDIARHVAAMGVDPQWVHVVPEGIDRSSSVREIRMRLAVLWDYQKTVGCCCSSEIYC